MKDRKTDQPNYFPRLPFVILACAGILLLATNVVLSYVLEDYPKLIGLILFGVYSVSAVIIVAVQTAKYNYINKINEDSAAFNTEIIDMFKYVTDIPYAIIDGEGNAVVTNNALQKLIGQSDKPLYKRPLSEFCEPDYNYLTGYTPASPTEGDNEDNSNSGIVQNPVFNIVRDSVECHGVPIITGRDTRDMSTYWSYELTAAGRVVIINGRRYEPRAHILKVKGKDYYFTTFTDIEDILEYRKRMEDNNVVVAYIVPDNLQEINKNYQSGYREAAAKLEAILRRFARSLDGYLREYERDKYMLVFTKEKLDECRSNKFRILSEVRSINISDISSEYKGSEIILTISIGIASICDTMRRREETAKNALETAMRRGGDQVVIQTDDETVYFGGHLKETMGNTVIEAKNAAQQAWYYIEQAETVFIMGHSFPDFDSIASCIGLARAAYDIISRKAGNAAYEDKLNDSNIQSSRAEDREMLRNLAEKAKTDAIAGVKERIKIVIDRTNANFEAFRKLLESTSSADDKDFYRNLFISGTAAPDVMPDDALLIITDVSNYGIVECPAIIERAKDILIIDHHRSATFSVEPAYRFIKSGASSASEIVASMIEHGNAEITLRANEATLMLTGIMLDTNKYSRNTTDLTFAAAQYLIRCGADQEIAREFFLDKVEVYNSESRILNSNIEFYRGIALAILDLGHELTGDDRVAASKAADRLISIQGVNAAFTLTKAGNVVSISARSNGKINVQSIAEKLGGGGHFNMAGAQIKDHTLTAVTIDLKNYIDEYFALEGQGTK